MSQKYDATIDPQLLTQLARAAGLQQSVAATFTLRNPSGQEPLSAHTTKAVVRKVLDRIADETQSKPNDVTVFPNLQSFAVDAPPDFIEHLLHQPEIDSATANYQAEDMLIQPVDSQPVPPDAVEGRRGAKSSPRAKRRRSR